MKQEKYPKLKKPQETLAMEGMVLRFSNGDLYIKHPDGHITKVQNEN